MIINGELQTGLGGGVCQVSTTVFNAAFEAGLSITARTNHALYISHYPLGRDATVDYPDSTSGSSTTPATGCCCARSSASRRSSSTCTARRLHRKVEVETAPLHVTGPAPLEKVKDPTLPKGEKEVEEAGVPAQATSVRRRVYAPGGKLMYDTTWYSSYRAEPKVVRIGTKPPEDDAATTTTTATAKPAIGLRPRNRLRQPRRQPRRPEGSRVDDAVARPAVGDRLSVALDRVLEAEARAAQVDAARVDEQPVVEDARASGSARASRARAPRTRVARIAG